MNEELLCQQVRPSTQKFHANECIFPQKIYELHLSRFEDKWQCDQEEQ